MGSEVVATSNHTLNSYCMPAIVDCDISGGYFKYIKCIDLSLEVSHDNLCHVTCAITYSEQCPQSPQNLWWAGELQKYNYEQLDL